MSSTLNLSGSVHFINNTVGSPTSEYPVCGAAIYLAYTTKHLDNFHKDIPHSILNINDEASVHFVSNTADCGGAVYLKSIVINIGNKVSMSFCKNKARNWHQVSSEYYIFGGAVLLHNSSLSTGANTKLHFNSNFAGAKGGAIYLWYRSEIRLNSNNVVIFTSNVAVNNGGALYMDHSSIKITGNTVVRFHNNTATIFGGGALQISVGHLIVQTSFIFIGNNSACSYAGGGIFMYSGNINISDHSVVNLTDNLVHLQGGGIYKSLEGIFQLTRILY